MKYIWLFSENLSKTRNNNSYYFWLYIATNHDDVDAYFVLEHSSINREWFARLGDALKPKIIWRNSLQHIKLYNQADMFFVTLSYRDVQPDKILFKSYMPMPKAPLVYLQHGILAIKQLSYKNYYAANSMVRFLYYNPEMYHCLQEVNGFKPYQLHYAHSQPRYRELLQRAQTHTPNKNLRILWFITWREYKANSFEEYFVVHDIYNVLSSAKLRDYLDTDNVNLTVCMHQKFPDAQIKVVRNLCKNYPRVCTITAQDKDIMDALVENDVLITDYSSVGFDFTLLGKAVILYQPDREYYLQQRKIYCTVEELADASVDDKDDLIKIIVKREYSINKFFAKRLPACSEKQEILSGAHLEQNYQHFWELQQKSVTFLGYDFSGVGGTVSATKALACNF